MVGTAVRRLAGLAAVAGLLLMVIFAETLYDRLGGLLDDIDDPVITYVVESNPAVSAAILYVSETGVVIVDADFGTGPWQQEVKVSLATAWVSVTSSFTDEGGSRVSCKILVNGRVFFQRESPDGRCEVGKAPPPR